MKAVYKNRLMKLYEHLKKGKLGQDVFNFNHFHASLTGKTCGTMGCAIGELPYLFKRDFAFEEDGLGNFTIRRRGHKATTTVSDVKGFFGITFGEYQHLFFPRWQNTEELGGKVLGEDATRYQVADNILAFLKVKENE